MTNPRTDRPMTDTAWSAIETERRRDRWLRRACVGAWVWTLALALLLVAAFVAPILQMFHAARAGDVPWLTVVGSAMPLFGALWTLSLLVASLATVGVFLRLRTASLSEIQLRLAAMEDIIANRQ